MKYSYSSNGEEFQGHCDSIMDAIAEACDDDDMGEVIYVGEAHQKTISQYFWTSDIERLLETMVEQAGEECGECVEGWMDGPQIARVKSETHEQYLERYRTHRKAVDEWLQPLKDDIGAALEKWANANNEQPGFWHVENVKEYDREGNLLS